MQENINDELTIKLPKDIAESVSNKEIISMLIDKALGKSEYYKSRCKEMEEKYNSDFNSYKLRIEKSVKENFSEYDDLMLWESYELAYKEWHHKYEELRSCKDSVFHERSNVKKCKRDIDPYQ